MKQLAVIRWHGKVVSTVLENNKLEEIYVDPEQRSILGSIYVGKIQKIISNIKAAFVEIGGGQMCYLPMSEGRFQCGDEVVVQVSRESVKSKQPTVTCLLQFTGKYFVLSKGKSGFRISAKIHDVLERARLQKLGERLELPNGYGLIMRTNAKDAGETVLFREFAFLSRQCMEIEQRGKYKICFSLLYQPAAPWISYWRDMDSSCLWRVITDDRNIYEELQEFAKQSQPEWLEQLVFYKDESYSLNHLLGIESKLKKLLDKKVWLKSGASLIIEPTEALTAIDVNTEKAIRGNRNPEATFFKINMEAAEEAARQIRLRNLSGILIIDFIDMKEKENKKRIMERLRMELGKDKLRANVVDMTGLGLVEITRMKRKKPLHEMLTAD